MATEQNDLSPLDYGQVIRGAYNDETRTLRMNALVPDAFDRIDVAYPDAVTEVYTYSFEGATMATVTVTYTTAAKDVLTSVAKA